MAVLSNKDLGKRVKALRAEGGMSQVELGEHLGIDQSSVSRIEGGSRVMTARELAAAAGAFAITIGHLVEEEVPVPALLRAGDADGEAVRESLRIFNDCINEYRGVEVLAG